MDEVKSLFELSERYRLSEPTRAIAHAEAGLALANEMGNSEWIAKLSMQLGHLWSAQGKRNTSSRHYLEALRYYEVIGDLHNTTSSLNAVGVEYYFMGYHHLALEYLLRALKNREQQADKYLLAQALNNLGLVYLGIQGYQEAADLFSRSLELKREFSDELGVSRTLSNLGYAHYHLGNYELALTHQKEAIDLRLSIGDEEGTAYAISIVGHVYKALERSDEALNAYQRSLALYRRASDARGVVEVLNNLGEILQRTGDLAGAERSYEEAIRLSKDIGDRRYLGEAHARLASVLEERGDFEHALELFKQSRVIENEIFNAQNLGQITEMRLRYDEERRDRELDLLRRDNALQEMELSQQRLQRNALIAGLMLVTLISGLFLVLYGQNRSTGRALAVKNTVIEQANRQLQSANEQLVAAHQRAELLARQDALTGLANRRGFTEALEREQARAARSGKPFSVLLADLDSFKSINDCYGHDVGDHVLARVASRLDGRIREQDLCARWGGEEFIILLAETDIEGARVLAEQLRKHIAAEPVEHESAEIPLTMTFGVANYNGTDLEELVSRADAALLRGKSQGKNCVVVHPRAGSAPASRRMPDTPSSTCRSG
ncbi:MAG TPA: tetratricopeptide repeat-containing diguanylate cyclase [Vicinamibacteria bacterium]|nr:tetratricopeptide repeat-containing diguanylate cyclase [Vicinamibacteria bacterium]